LNGGHALEATCRNCDANLGELPANFCPACGQDTLNHPPAFWEFVHEFITHYVALEGKLWKTLWLLFLKPAELTREYRAGRKQRYISPLRLYITASFLFFLVVKIAGLGSAITFSAEDAKADKPFIFLKADADPALKSHSTASRDKQDSAAVSNTAAKHEEDAADGGIDKMVKGIVAEAAESAKQGATAGSVAGAKAAKENADKSPDDDSINVADFTCAAGEKTCQWLKDHLQAKYKGKTQTQVLGMLRDGAIANIPYAMFMMLPLFALLTKLLYINRGYYYGEHVVYALHIHAFTFFVMLLSALLPDWLAVTVLVAAAIYYLVALQRFFGGNWLLTSIRYSVIGIIYPILLSFVASFVLIFIAIV
jgi:Protein of unknown function (DUF3667)